MYPQVLTKGTTGPRAHGGALTGHFSLNKTIDILKEHFYWPKVGGGSSQDYFCLPHMPQSKESVPQRLVHPTICPLKALG